MYKDIAILYRNHQISNNFEKELVKNQIPYHMLGSLSFLKHKEIKIIIKNYHFFKYHDDIRLKEIYNIPNRKIGETTFFNIEREAISKGVSVYHQMLESDNEHIKEFVKKISILEKYILQDEPHEFIKRLLSEIKYNDYLLRQEKAKIKLDRMFEFIKMFEDIKITDNPFQETLEFLNQIN